MSLGRWCDYKFLTYDSVGLNVAEFAPLFLHQSPDSVTHYEGRGLALVPCHKVTVRHLAMPHFCAERRIDNAARTVCMKIATLRIDLLNRPASPYCGRRLQRAGRNITRSGRTAVWDTGRRRSSRAKWAAQKAVEKTGAAPPWNTLRVSHFPTSTTATVFRPAMPSAAQMS
jgi:hypothetical protein